MSGCYRHSLSLITTPTGRGFNFSIKQTTLQTNLSISINNEPLTRERIVAYRGGIWASLFVFSDQCTFQFCLNSVTHLLLKKSTSNSVDFLPEGTDSITAPSQLTYSSASTVFIEEIYKHLSYVHDDMVKLTPDLRMRVKQSAQSEINGLIGSHFQRTDYHWCNPELSEEEATTYWSKRLMISLKLERWSELPLIIWQLDVLTEDNQNLMIEPIVISIDDFSIFMDIIKKQSAGNSVCNQEFHDPLKSISTSFETKRYLFYAANALQESKKQEYKGVFQMLKEIKTESLVYTARVDNYLSIQMPIEFPYDFYEPQPKPIKPTIQQKHALETCSDDENDDTTEEANPSSALPQPKLDELEALTQRLHIGQCDAETCLQQYLLFREAPNISQRHLVLVNLNIFEQALIIASSHCRTIQSLTKAVHDYSNTLNHDGLKASKPKKYKFAHAVRELPAHFVKAQEALEHVHLFLTALKDEHAATNIKCLGDDYHTSKKLLESKKECLNTLLKNIQNEPQNLTTIYQARYKLLKEGGYLKELHQSEHRITSTEMTLSIEAAQQLATLTKELEKVYKDIEQLKL